MVSENMRDVITRGFGSTTIITRGYGLRSVVEVTFWPSGGSGGGRYGRLGREDELIRRFTITTRLVCVSDERVDDEQKLNVQFDGAQKFNVELLSFDKIGESVSSYLDNMIVEATCISHARPLNEDVIERQSAHADVYIDELLCNVIEFDVSVKSDLQASVMCTLVCGDSTGAKSLVFVGTRIGDRVKFEVPGSCLVRNVVYNAHVEITIDGARVELLRFGLALK